MFLSLEAYEYSHSISLPHVEMNLEGTASSEQRILTTEEAEKLSKQDETLVSDFKKNKLEVDAKKNWDLFYKRNETRFFRDRHWTIREFEQLVDLAGENNKTLFEVGCGVGNFVFPLLEIEARLFIYACDFSPRAVEFVQKDSRYDPLHMKAFVCDITKDR